MFGLCFVIHCCVHYTYVTLLEYATAKFVLGRWRGVMGGGGCSICGFQPWEEKGGKGRISKGDGEGEKWGLRMQHGA